MWVVAGRPAPVHFAPREGASFVCTRSVNLAAGCTAVMDHIPAFSLARSLLLKVLFSRAVGASGWFPGVLVEECHVKKAHFSDF